jgi:flavin reductase (DIM6/NTAB) family NADH-FMN oxidoreductase RutF
MSDTMAVEVRTAFLDAMSDVCAPVSVVTTTLDGRPHGTTVSAFCSLSATPPMVLVSLDNTSRLLADILLTRRFGLNVLAHDQSAVARRFASKDEDKFVGIEFDDADGAPRLIGMTAWVSCTVEETTIGGDHTVLFGRVQEAVSRHAAPLTYHSRAFGTHSPLEQ